MDFDTTVKLSVYRSIAETTRVPKIAELAAALGSREGDIKQAFHRLFKKRLLVLEPETSEIRMAPPFSAVPTPFLVHAGGKSYFANCVWDAYGVSAALHRDATVETTCGDCAAPLTMGVRDSAPVSYGWSVHFAVPAAHWWDDIVFS
jgi:hypothetical protein